MRKLGSCLWLALGKRIAGCVCARPPQVSLLPLLVGGLPACARTHVETPGPAAAAPAVASGDAGGAANASPDGGAAAEDLENGRAPAMTALRLPWSAGETWYLTSGPHSTKRSALDFAPPNIDPRPAA